MPFTFVNKEDYATIEQGDKIEIDLTSLESGTVALKNLTKGTNLTLTHSLSQTEIEVLKAGGKLPFIKQRHTK